MKNQRGCSVFIGSILEFFFSKVWKQVQNRSNEFWWIGISFGGDNLTGFVCKTMKIPRNIRYQFTIDHQGFRTLRHLNKLQFYRDCRAINCNKNFRNSQTTVIVDFNKFFREFRNAIWIQIKVHFSFVCHKDKKK